MVDVAAENVQEAIQKATTAARPRDVHMWNIRPDTVEKVLRHLEHLAHVGRISSLNQPAYQERLPLTSFAQAWIGSCRAKIVWQYLLHCSPIVLLHAHDQDPAVHFKVADLQDRVVVHLTRVPVSHVNVRRWNSVKLTHRIKLNHSVLQTAAIIVGEVFRPHDVIASHNPAYRRIVKELAQYLQLLDLLPL